MKASKAQIITSFCLLILISMGSGMPKDAKDHIQGSWTLIKYKYGSDQELAEVPKVVRYVKHITGQHFAWASYGENGNLVGAGGGTYEVDKSQYIENIDYFHPHGSNLSGTYVTFDYQLKGNDWTISGYIKNVQLNPGTGEYESIDSVQLEEVWRKL